MYKNKEYNISIKETHGYSVCGPDDRVLAYVYYFYVLVSNIIAVQINSSNFIFNKIYSFVRHMRRRNLCIESYISHCRASH